MRACGSYLRAVSHPNPNLDFAGKGREDTVAAKMYPGGNAAGHQGVVRRFGGGEEGYKRTPLEGVRGTSLQSTELKYDSSRVE